MLFLRISKLRRKEFFHALLESRVLCTNINIGKLTASPKLQL